MKTVILSTPAKGQGYCRWQFSSERERSYFEIPSLRCQVDRATYIKTQGGMAQAKHSSDSDKQIHFNLDKAKTIPHSH